MDSRALTSSPISKAQVSDSQEQALPQPSTATVDSDRVKACENVTPLLPSHAPHLQGASANQATLLGRVTTNLPLLEADVMASLGDTEAVPVPLDSDDSLDSDLDISFLKKLSEKDNAIVNLRVLFNRVQVHFTERLEEDIPADITFAQLEAFAKQISHYLYNFPCLGADKRRICLWCEDICELFPGNLPGVPSQQIESYKHLLKGLVQLLSDKNKACRLLTLSAEAGNAIGCFWLGLTKVNDDPESAISYFKKACAGGVQEARSWVGELLVESVENWCKTVLEEVPRYVEGEEEPVIDQVLSEEHRDIYEKKALEAAEYGEFSLLALLANCYMWGTYGFEIDENKGYLLLTQGVLEQCPVCLCFKGHFMARFSDENRGVSQTGSPCEAADYFAQARASQAQRDWEQTQTCGEMLAMGKCDLSPHTAYLEDIYDKQAEQEDVIPCAVMEIFGLGCSYKEKKGWETLVAQGDSESLFWMAIAQMNGLVGSSTREDARKTALRCYEQGGRAASALLARLWEKDWHQNGAAKALAKRRYCQGDREIKERLLETWNDHGHIFFYISIGDISQALTVAEKSCRGFKVVSPEDEFAHHTLHEVFNGPGSQLKHPPVAGSYRGAIRSWRKSMCPRACNLIELSNLNASLKTSEACLMHTACTGEAPMTLPGYAVSQPRTAFRALELIYEGYFQFPAPEVMDKLEEKVCELTDEECFLLRTDPGVEAVITRLRCKREYLPLENKLHRAHKLAMLSGDPDDFCAYANKLGEKGCYMEAVLAIQRAKNEYVSIVWRVVRSGGDAFEKAQAIQAKLDAVEVSLHEAAKKAGSVCPPFDPSLNRLPNLEGMLEKFLQPQEGARKTVLEEMRASFPAIYHATGDNLQGNTTSPEYRQRLQQYFYLLGLLAHGDQAYSEAAEYWHLAKSDRYSSEKGIVAEPASDIETRRKAISAKLVMLQLRVNCHLCELLEEQAQPSYPGEVSLFTRLADDIATLGSNAGYAVLYEYHLELFRLGGCSWSAVMACERFKNRALADCSSHVVTPCLLSTFHCLSDFALPNPRLAWHSMKWLPQLDENQNADLKHSLKLLELSTLDIHHVGLYTVALACKGKPGYEFKADPKKITVGQKALAEVIATLSRSKKKKKPDIVAKMQKLEGTEKTTGLLLIAQLCVYGEMVPPDGFDIDDALKNAALQDFTCAKTSKGILALRNGDRSLALQHFYDARSIVVRIKHARHQAIDPEALHLSGLCYLADKNYGMAFECFDAATDCNYVPALCMLKKLSLRNDEFKFPERVLDEPWINQSQLCALTKDLEALGKADGTIKPSRPKRRKEKERAKELSSEELKKIDALATKISSYKTSTDPLVIFELLVASHKHTALSKKLSQEKLVGALKDCLGLAHDCMLALHPDLSVVLEIIETVAKKTGKDYSGLLGLLVQKNQTEKTCPKTGAKKPSGKVPKKPPKAARSITPPPVELDPSQLMSASQKTSEDKSGSPEVSTKTPEEESMEVLGSIPEVKVDQEKEPEPEPKVENVTSSKRKKKHKKKTGPKVVLMPDPPVLEPLPPPVLPEVLESEPKPIAIDQLSPASLVEELEREQSDFKNSELLEELDKRYKNGGIPAADKSSVCHRVMEYCYKSYEACDERAEQSLETVAFWLQRAYGTATSSEAWLLHLQVECAKGAPDQRRIADCVDQLRDSEPYCFPDGWTFQDYFHINKTLGTCRPLTDVSQLMSSLQCQCFTLIRSSQLILLEVDIERCLEWELTADNLLDLTKNIAESDELVKMHQAVNKVITRSVDVMTNAQLFNDGTLKLCDNLCRKYPDLIIKICQLKERSDLEPSWWNLYCQAQEWKDNEASADHVMKILQNQIEDVAKTLTHMRSIDCKIFKQDLKLLNERLRLVEDRVSISAIAPLRKILKIKLDAVSARNAIDKFSRDTLPNPIKKNLKSLSRETLDELSLEDKGKAIYLSMTENEWKEYSNREEKNKKQIKTILSIESGSFECWDKNTLLELKHTLSLALDLNLQGEYLDRQENCKALVEFFLAAAVEDEDLSLNAFKILVDSPVSNSMIWFVHEKITPICERSINHLISVVSNNGELDELQREAKKNILHIWGMCGLSKQKESEITQALEPVEEGSVSADSQDNDTVTEPSVSDLEPANGGSISCASNSASEEESSVDEAVEEIPAEQRVAKQVVEEAIDSARKVLQDEFDQIGYGFLPKAKLLPEDIEPIPLNSEDLWSCFEVSKNSAADIKPWGLKDGEVYNWSRLFMDSKVDPELDSWGDDERSLYLQQTQFSKINKARVNFCDSTASSDSNDPIDVRDGAIFNQADAIYYLNNAEYYCNKSDFEKAWKSIQSMKLIVDGDFRHFHPDSIKTCQEVLNKIRENAEEEHRVQILEISEYQKLLMNMGCEEDCIDGRERLIDKAVKVSYYIRDANEYCNKKRPEKAWGVFQEMKSVIDDDFKKLSPDMLMECCDVMRVIEKGYVEKKQLYLDKITQYEELLDMWSGTSLHVDCVSDKKYQGKYSNPECWKLLALQEKDMLRLNRSLYLRRGTVEPKEVLLLKEHFMRFRSEMLDYWEKSDISVETYYGIPRSSLSDEDTKYLESEDIEKKVVEESPRDKKMRAKHGDGWPVYKNGEYFLHEHTIDKEVVEEGVYEEMESDEFLKNPSAKADKYQTWIEQLRAEDDSSASATYQTLLYLLMAMNALLENNEEKFSENMGQCKKIIGRIQMRTSKTARVIDAVLSFYKNQWENVPDKVGDRTKSMLEVQFFGLEMQLNSKPVKK